MREFSEILWEEENWGQRKSKFETGEREREKNMNKDRERTIPRTRQSKREILKVEEGHQAEER